MKPVKKLSEPKLKERKQVIREWLKFAVNAVKIERRSKLSGVVLSTIPEKARTLYQAELGKLLPLKFEGKLPEAQEPRFHWLLQVFSLKDLTDIIKKSSYEFYKQSNFR